MALRALILGKKLTEARAKLEKLREKDAEFQTREAELEEAIDEAETEEDRTEVEGLVEEFEEEKKTHEEEKKNLEEEISDMENELKEITKEPAERTRRSAEEKRGENRPMETRKKFFGMSAQERDAFFADEEVKAFLQRARDLAAQERTITGAELSIPPQVLELIRENAERYSKMISRVRVRRVPGKARQNVMGAFPEAIWTETCASLNELNFGFTQTELDGYKVGGIIYICIATLEDSDYDLASEIINALGAAIGIALD